MSFWENLGQKATETTGKAVQKAKELSELAKLNSMVSEEEKKDQQQLWADWEDLCVHASGGL